MYVLFQCRARFHEDLWALGCLGSAHRLSYITQWYCLCFATFASLHVQSNVKTMFRFPSVKMMDRYFSAWMTGTPNSVI